jgi:hypothetical protein
LRSTNYLKYRRGLGTGRTIAPKSGVSTGVAMLPHHPRCIENQILAAIVVFVAFYALEDCSLFPEQVDRDYKAIDLSMLL